MSENNNELKYLRHDPYMNPNNYDIYIPVEDIPANIEIENSQNLEKRLQKLMPLSKLIHVNFESKVHAQNNNLNIFSNMRINYNVNDEIIVKEVNFL